MTEARIEALDATSDVDTVSVLSGAEELRSRLEVLLGAKPEAPVDVSLKREEQTIIADDERRHRVAAAGGELLGAVFNFLGELVQHGQSPPPPDSLVENVRGRLDACVEDDASGRPRLSLTLPDRAALDQLAQTLSKLLVAAQPGG
jgi:hypothetical protein